MKIVMNAYKIIEKHNFGGIESYAVAIFNEKNARKYAEVNNEDDIIAALNEFADELVPSGIAYQIHFSNSGMKGSRSFKGFNKLKLELIVNEDKIDGVL